MKVYFNKPEPNTYRAGDVFKINFNYYKNSNQHYVLAKVGIEEFNLINLASWNRFGPSIKRQNSKLGKEDIEKLCDPFNFTLIARNLNIIP